MVTPIAPTGTSLTNSTVVRDLHESALPHPNLDGRLLYVLICLVLKFYRCAYGEITTMLTRLYLRKINSLLKLLKLIFMAKFFTISLV